MLLKELNERSKLTVYTTQPVCIFSKSSQSWSECWDNNTSSILDISKIDDSYGLDLVESNNRIDVYIPRNAKCILTKPDNPNMDCTIVYKNIECDLSFEDDAIELYFDISEE